MQFTAEEFSPRTELIHEDHCKSLKKAARDVSSTSCGVTRKAILNDLTYFHVTSGLPPDLMHDVFEGVAVVELHCMINSLIKQSRLFNLSRINNRISKFPYGYIDSTNKPLPFISTYLSKSPTEALKQNCKMLGTVKPH